MDDALGLAAQRGGEVAEHREALVGRLALDVAVVDLLRDDGEAYDHYAAGNWAGIVGPVRADMVTYAY